jgi:predicted CXXCH cytochrome family protein
VRTISALLAAACLLIAQDHVDKPLPDYVTGDECLFCHDRNVGITWQTNPHAWTIRPAGTPPATAGAQAGATHALGADTRARWLKLAGYGRFDLLAADGKEWQGGNIFANRCAGCHTTAVDPATRAFSTFALDCYTCHGVVAPAHTGVTALVWLSKKHEAAPRLVVSICGQCHLRGGRSHSSELPFPNNFVAGDDLFADFRIADAKVDTGDRHIYRNVRDVLGRGGTVTCVSCHRVHGDSSQKHRFESQGEICLECHNATGAKKDVRRPEKHSTVCEY